MIKVCILTGFLGVGKTTALNQLILQRPENEKWAVIVNEFGEIGIDAALLAQPGIIIKQVPGGCACCATKLTFQTHLNQLLKSQHLDRIFIEPSGLGHADSLANILKEDQYHKWLQLDSIITVLNAHQFMDYKYRYHEIYQRQLQSADGYIINKADLALSENIQQIQAEIEGWGRPFIKVNQGRVDINWLSKVKHLNAKNNIKVEQAISNDTFYKASITLGDEKCFNLTHFIDAIKPLALQRIKGVINTNQGPMLINGVSDQISVSHNKHGKQPCLIEMIDTSPINIEAITKLIDGAETDE